MSLVPTFHPPLWLVETWYKNQLLVWVRQSEGFLNRNSHSNRLQRNLNKFKMEGANIDMDSVKNKMVRYDKCDLAMDMLCMAGDILVQ